MSKFLHKLAVNDFIRFVEIKKKVTLVNISKYAEKWSVTRDVIYDRLKAGTLTAYVREEDEDKKGNIYLNLEENPQVRTYSKEDEKVEEETTSEQ